MPVIELQGDLLASDCGVIGHCCNCFHTMGSGIARAIREKYPAAYQADLQTEYGSKDKLGAFSRGHCGKRIVYNLYGQYKYGTNQAHIDYSALKASLNKMKYSLQSLYPWPKALDKLKIGFPRLGCGLAGGEWTTVKQILEEVFHDTTVYVYSL